MTRSTWQQRARVAVILAAALAPTLACVHYGGGEDSEKDCRGSVHVSEAQIPRLSGPLPVLRTTPPEAPLAILRELLHAAVPGASDFAPLSQYPLLGDRGVKAGTDILASFADHRLAAVADRRTGDAEVFPLLAELKPMTGSDGERAIAVAREIFSRSEIIARDDTRAVPSPALVLNGETVARDTGAGRSQKAAAYLAYVPLRRYVGSYPVYGPGSRALAVVGEGGVVHGLVRRWKTAVTARQVAETRPAAEVAKEIARQLEALARRAEVTVQVVEIAYYDGHRDYLQPVYRFTARIRYRTAAPRQDAGAKRTDDDFVIGYVPIGQPPEPLPVLGGSPRRQPAAGARGKASPPRSPYAAKATDLLPSPASAPGAASSPGALADPLVGRYVVRDDDPDWVNDANEFWDGLAGSPTAGLFTDAQYFWAEPFEFIGDSQDFVNNVEVALNEVHGDWWLFSTEKNCCDLVDITTIPFPGYGAAAGGRLAYWILHSCEVVPAPDDTTAWADPWWNVFGGLHSVLGYRTVMYIDDDVGGPFAQSVGNVAPAVSAWLNTLSSASAYSGNPTYPNHLGINKPMGRAATISSCGREDDAIFDTSPLPRASCLRIFWFPD
jgi:Family of unknown function (DUF6345)